jgi:hypothetical protein
LEAIKNLLHTTVAIAPRLELALTRIPSDRIQSTHWLVRILREPLLHFLIIGALLFGLSFWVHGSSLNSTSPKQIEVSAGTMKNAPGGKRSAFLVAALKDQIGANLDRIQIVKGWLGKDGQAQEQVYDVAGVNGKFPTVGSLNDNAIPKEAPMRADDHAVLQAIVFWLSGSVALLADDRFYHPQPLHHFPF